MKFYLKANLIKVGPDTNYFEPTNPIEVTMKGSNSNIVFRMEEKDYVFDYLDLERLMRVFREFQR